MQDAASFKSLTSQIGGLPIPFRANSRVKKRHIWRIIKAIATKKRDEEMTKENWKPQENH